MVRQFSNTTQIVGASLGLLPDDLARISEDNNVVQFLAATAVSVVAFTEAVRQYRIVITEGNIGEPTPDFPADRRIPCRPSNPRRTRLHARNRRPARHDFNAASRAPRKLAQTDDQGF